MVSTNSLPKSQSTHLSQSLHVNDPWRTLGNSKQHVGWVTCDLYEYEHRMRMQNLQKPLGFQFSWGLSLKRIFSRCGITDWDSLVPSILTMFLKLALSVPVAWWYSITQLLLRISPLLSLGEGEGRWRRKRRGRCFSRCINHRVMKLSQNMKGNDSFKFMGDKFFSRCQCWQSCKMLPKFRLTRLFF